MDISKAVKSGYFQALSPEIGVNIYDAFAIPENAEYPYVIISSVSVSEIPTTDLCKKFNVDVSLDIVTGFSSPTGMDAAFDIGEDIEAIVNPNSGVDLDISAYGWRIGETRLTGTQPIQLRTDNFYIYRQVRTYSHIVIPV